jgi:hypothetical protein
MTIVRRFAFASTFVVIGLLLMAFAMGARAAGNLAGQEPIEVIIGAVNCFQDITTAVR